MKLYNTATKAYDEFTPGKTIGMYVCGITPYDAAHVGHIFTFMAYDLVQRRLESLGHTVRLVRNITDVDEPIFKKARQLGIPYTDLAEQETQSFQSVLTRLNFRPPFAEPKASQFIAEMAAAVQQLQAAGFGYAVDNDVYFDVSKLEAFGDFSGFSKKLQLGFMKMRGGDPARPGKRNPLDFLLWKSISSPTDPAAWDSIVGRGRPGWHIECSVMSSELLDIPFDLHGGGYDLVFPHHECEVAQAAGLGLTNPARFWLHIAPMQQFGEKMSKSLGNLVFAKDILKHHTPSAFRLALMQYHYQTGGEWQACYLHDAQDLLEDLGRCLAAASDDAVSTLYETCATALDDNLDTPQVIHALKHFVEASPASGGLSTTKAARLPRKAHSAKTARPARAANPYPPQTAGPLQQLWALLGLQPADFMPRM